MQAQAAADAQQQQGAAALAAQQLGAPTVFQLQAPHQPKFQS